jgi:hypothetical protein
MCLSVCSLARTRRMVAVIAVRLCFYVCICLHESAVGSSQFFYVEMFLFVHVCASIRRVLTVIVVRLRMYVLLCVY